jgi:hypothetical protein
VDQDQAFGISERGAQCRAASKAEQNCHNCPATKRQQRAIDDSVAERPDQKLSKMDVYFPEPNLRQTAEATSAGKRDLD